MGRLGSLRRWNARIDGWLVDHPRVFFLVLASVPVLTIVGLSWVTDGSVHEATVHGAVLGVTYATIVVLVRRWRS